MICYIVDSIFFRDFVKHLLAIKLNRHRHQTHITKANLLLPLGFVWIGGIRWNGMEWSGMR
jgi:hypothetical protein